MRRRRFGPRLDRLAAYFADGVDTFKAQILYPESGFTPGWNETHLVWTMEAIQETLDMYNAQSAPCLYVMLSVHGGSSSYVLDATDTTGCAIFLNTPMQNRQEGQFKQEVARDIAHCIVPVVWPDQFAVATFTQRRWWNGALAESLSNVVYPDTTCTYGRCDLEWRLAPTLAAQELAVPMMERQDANWMFFQHLWFLSGLEGIIDLVDQIPASSSSFDHEQALADIPGLEEQFHHFAETLTDAAVLDSGGGAVPYSPPSERIRVSGEATIQRNPDPFGTKRLHLVVDPGNVACISATTSENVRVTYRPGGPADGGEGGWQPVPTDETVYSGEFVIVATTVRPDGGFTLEVDDVTDGPDCEEEEEPVETEQPEPVDLPCPQLCGPSDYYRYLEQLAAWFQQIMNSATGT